MKYGPDITKEIADHLRMGMGRVDACRLAFISYETFTVWMEKPEFSEAVKRAESEFKQRNVAIIQRAAIKSWQAAAWLLERKYQDEFAVKNNFGGVITVESRPLEKVPDEYLRRILADALAAGSAKAAQAGDTRNGASS